MLAKRIVACLDIRAGRVVKGRAFLALRDAGDPVERAKRYCEAGIDEIVVLDVSATLEDRLASCATIEAIAREVDVPVTVGGGVRTIDDFSLLLEAGADKVAVNSAAVTSPHLLTNAANRYGSQCVVLSIDSRKRNAGFEVATRSASLAHHIDALEWARRGEALGAGELLLTSIDRDGSREGFDVELISRAAATVEIPIIASGGACDADSFADVLDAGADAALGGSVFHYDNLTPESIKRRCAERGLVVRA